MEKLTKSKERVDKYGEVFTPDWIVKEMCDMLKEENKDAFTTITKTFLEPSCGTGNFLVEILKRKLDACNDRSDCLTALSSIYGIDLLPDNVEESRSRMRAICDDCFGADSIVDEILESHIICGNFLTGLNSAGERIWFLDDQDEYWKEIEKRQKEEEKKAQKRQKSSSR